MDERVISGILIPFIGTTSGSALVFLMRGKIKDRIQRALTGFAGGVMVAASVWSLILPAFLCFAAGAMIYVVVEELIPEMSAGEHSNVGVLMFSLGFTLMMALDVALG